MADETENNVEETQGQTPDVSETDAAPEAAADSPEVSDTEVADAPEAAEAPVSDTEVAPEAPAEEAAPEAPAVSGPKVKRRRMPRSERHKHSKPAREKPAKRKPITRTAPADTVPPVRQERRGIVVSDKGEKTIVVKVAVTKLHPKYKKVVRRTQKFHAHDEENVAGIGDIVRIVESRPISKTKNWRLAEIVEKAR